MKILIIGADGQLGTDLCKVMNDCELIPLTIKDINIVDEDKTLEVISLSKPDIVINTAAYNQVEFAEDNNDLAWPVNALGAKNVAIACKRNNAVMVHISTDYVFDGGAKTPYVELDIPNPQNAYGLSKFAGENYVKCLITKCFIVRSSGLYGVAGCMGKGGRNFVDSIIMQAGVKKELAVVADEILTPTYSLDLAEKINELCRTNHFGLYHVTNAGECSWYDFACKACELANINVRINKISGETFNTKVKRPRYSVLSNKKLNDIGLQKLRPWEIALHAYLKERGIC